MDFSRFDGTYLAIAGVMLLLLGIQSVLVNRRRAWLGIFVPAAYLGILVYLGVTGRVSSLTDFVVAALGLLGLVAWWASARESRREKSQEDQRLVITTWTAADSGVSFPPPGTGVRRHSQVRVG
ncbi:MAG: hypothetical protein ABIS84_11105 [Arachnia sp.]